MMPSLLSIPFEVLLLSSLVLFILHLPTTTSDQLFLKTFCPNNTANYTADSTFGTNLNSLLSSLSSNASLTGFSNGTIGENPNRVYGLAQCRGDTTPDRCLDCLNTARQELLTNCPNRTGLTWYDRCLLRYSNQPFSSSSRNRPLLIIFYDPIKSSSEQIQFNMSMVQLMNDLALKAAFSPSKRMYATNKTNFNNSPSIYGLMQCADDLSRNDCKLCLQNTIDYIPKCCEGRYGVRLVGSSCNLRFDMYKFYDDLPIAPPPPAPAPSTTPSLIPPLPNTTTMGDKKNKSRKVLMVVIPVIITFVLICTCLLWRRRKSDDRKSLLFDFGTLRAATNDFSDANKLGEGGFGPVYKGRLVDGQEIAVKKLSRTSGQGAGELINEVALLSKIQHTNLVKLLGCCLEKQEKMLVYEFLPNTSLDSFLFDPIKCLQLNWERRYKIILGIARGLLYLHEDSPLRIIHRDLKSSNILLDHDLNPKISDFGLAKLFGEDQTHGSTIHIAGTRGYMPPEYAMGGKFSTKLDVFSFGVLVLEIVTGRKSACFQESECATNLLSYAWRHWTQGTVTQMVDRTLGNQCPTGEVMRCIHLGLLCVQEDASRRPSISSAVLTLESYSITFPDVALPAFCYDRTKTSSNVHARGSNLSLDESDQSSNRFIQSSANEVTITDLEPR